MAIHKEIAKKKTAFEKMALKNEEGTLGKRTRTVA